MVLRVMVILLLLSTVGCSLEKEEEPLIIFVTATPGEQSDGETAIIEDAVPTQTVQEVPVVVNTPLQYTVQAGDTLFGIALAHNTSIDTLLSLNQLVNPDVLTVGQVLQIPGVPETETPNVKIMADARFVRGTAGRTFDVEAFVAQQPGYIRQASDKITNRLAIGLTADEFLSAAQVVERVSTEFSVDPRLLLALLEYRAGWLSNVTPLDHLKDYPMISEEQSGAIDRKGLYRQLAWTANELNRGYYGYKYEGWDTIEFDSGERLRISRELNPSTVGLQHFLHLHSTVDRWLFEVNLNGFYRIYSAYFGDPLVDEGIITVPSGMSQPEMTFPFSAGETWFFTGGPHGGWGNGSAWASVDFAPPDDPKGVACYISEYPVTAVAAGIVARSERGTVILDLDGDGDERSGWTVLYLHLTNRISAGTRVEVGDTLGYASCEGGFSTATHMHIGRRYNGEWIPATCQTCDVNFNVPPFVLSGWRIVSFRNQEYQGYMQKDGERRIAEQGRNTPENRVFW